MFESLLFDSNLRRDARLASGSNYSAIVELSTRQSFATFELTEHSQDENGVMGFLKEISSNGDCSVIFIFLFLLEFLSFDRNTNDFLFSYIDCRRNFPTSSNLNLYKSNFN